MSSGGALTRREREVAALVAEGLTNREIAVKLFISERTAESHVEQIRNKLGFHSRTQIAAWVAAHGLEPPVVAAQLPPARTAELRSRRLRLVTPRLAIPIALVAILALAVGAIALWPRPSGPLATITTVTGTGLAVGLDRPVAVAIDNRGTVYVADGNRVHRLAAGKVTVAAGAGDPGFGGDGGPATAAHLRGPQALALNPDGDLFIADTLNNRVRRVDRAGIITTIAGTGEPGYSGDGGPATLAQLSAPAGLAGAGGGNLYVADRDNDRVRRIDSGGTIVTVAGTGEPGYAGEGGPATSAPFNSPGGLAVDDQGNLYIADLLNDRVRRVDPDGVVTTVAGTGGHGFSGDSGRASAATLSLDVGPPSGTGQGLAVDSQGALYIADTVNERIRRIGLDGTITTVVGSGQAGYAGDGGPARSAWLGSPLGVAIDPWGVLYIADTENNRVRRVTLLTPGG